MFEFIVENGRNIQRETMAPKVLYLVRHAEGAHNVSLENHGIHDPDLTEKGKQQCRSLCQTFEFHDKINLLVASPIRRTIQTALFSFEPVVRRGLKILALPGAQESSDDPCDTGSPTDLLRQEFGGVVDLHLMENDWNSKSGKYAPDVPHLQERARELRCWLRARSEEQVVVVSHGDFLHHVTGNIDDRGQQTGMSAPHPSQHTSGSRRYAFLAIR